MNPTLLAGPAFLPRIETLLQALRDTPGVRLPGERRLAARQQHQAEIRVRRDLWQLIQRYARGERGEP